MTNEQELVLGGAVLGGMFSAVLMFALVFYILTVIATWKIFKKAGIEGWKSLIPIYNAYLLYKIAGVNFWIYGLLMPFISSFILELAKPLENNGGIQALLNLVGIAVIIVAEWKFVKGLANAFGKGTGYALGLLLLPNIFLLVLGFGSDKFQGTLE